MLNRDSSSEEWRDAVLRVQAAAHELAAGRHRFEAAMLRTTVSLRRFERAMVAAERRDVQEHPDLAELDVQLEGFYGQPPS